MSQRQEVSPVKSNRGSTQTSSNRPTQDRGTSQSSRASGDKKNIKILALVLAALIFLDGVSTVWNFHQCGETLSSFEDACNKLDVGEILNCIDPKVSDPLKLVVSGISILTQSNVEEYLEQAVKLILDGTVDFLEEGEDISDVLQNMEVSPKLIRSKMGWKKSTIFCEMTVRISGTEIKKDIKIKMVKRNGEWYVSGISLAN